MLGERSGPMTMALQRDEQFDAADVEARTLGAGVMPCATAPDGTLHFLLGRERFLPSWRGSCRWSAFEGTRNHHESVVGTAAREFTEESLGVVLPRAAAERALRERAYERRLVLRIVSGDRLGYHCMYVQRVPWDPELPRRFERVRAALDHLERLAHELATTRPSLLEGMTVGPIEEEDGLTVRVVATPHSGVVRSPWVCAAARGPRVVQTWAGDGLARAVRAWEECRARVERALVDHECVRVERDALFGAIQSVRLVRDHLEKDQVRWWSAPQLAEVITRRGVRDPDRFRPYFLPVLQLALDELAPSVVAAFPRFRVASAPRAPSPPAAPRAPSPPTAPPPADGRREGA